MDPFCSVEKIPGVGPYFEKNLEKLGIKTTRDFLYHFPRRYNDYRNAKMIGSLVPGEIASIEGLVESIANIRTRNAKFLTKAVVSDQTGSVLCVFFNQRFLSKTLKKGVRVGISGKTGVFDKKTAFIAPEYEVVPKKGVCYKTRGLVPVYPESGKINSKWMRAKIRLLLEKVDMKGLEIIPENIRKKEKLPSFSQAIRKIHFPQNQEDIDLARRRFGFEELFTAQLISITKKIEWGKRGVSRKLVFSGTELLNFMECLPFRMTDAQIRVSKQILQDLSKEVPANRLVQGDVGSGKTVVAALAMFASLKSKSGSLFMAPTEILARQHYNNLKDLFKKIDPAIKIDLITGRRKKTSQGEPSITVGTHALLYSKSLFKNISLVIIDEQHKFGVEQRSAILRKVDQKHTPHLITMTATPIPRSLALTLYSELDISEIDEMPPGRKKTKTFVIQESKRESMYNWIKRTIKREKTGAYIICPFIEESNIDTLKEVKAAVKLYKTLREGFLKGLKLGLIHGRMSGEEKDKVMESFKNKEIDILVSTPVVEVGMDVKHANIIVIEGAERFGLASLHQLRGRIGRGGGQGYCFLLTTKGKKSAERLRKMERYTSGLRLANEDLKTRGPGELYGIMQHGKPVFRFADITNVSLAKKTYEYASVTAKNIGRYRKTGNYLGRLSPKGIKPN